MIINFILNGSKVSFNIPPDLRVVDLLREHLNLTGTKEACGSGECGACTILVNNESKLSCLMLSAQLQNKNITTIEGISDGKDLHPIQKKFIEKGAIQCGFCTPGMIIATINLLNNNPSPSREEIREGISGNLCRCTGYHKIVDAIESASKSFCRTNEFPKISPQKIINIEKLIGKSKANVFIPETLNELWEIKKNNIIYAGGTDILTKRRKGLIAEDKNLICIERKADIKKIEDRGNEVFIGAAATHSDIMSSEIVKKNFPILIQAIKVLGSPPIRNMGTIGGNICTASPAGDTLPPLYVLDAILDIRSMCSKRLISIKDFIKSPGVTDLKSDEILYGINIKKVPHFNFHYYEKVGQRNALSISIAGIAILAKIVENRIEDIKIAWGSVAPTVITSNKINNELIGKEITEQNLKSIFPLIDEVVSPISDIRASKEYRRLLAKNLLLRLL